MHCMYIPGLGGTPATVGIDSGDMVNFMSVPGSGTADVINISSTSNVGIPGMWLFQINQTQDQGRITNVLYYYRMVHVCMHSMCDSNLICECDHWYL